MQPNGEMTIPLSGTIYCHPCSKSIVENVIKQEKDGVPQEEWVIPQAKPAWTYTYANINGLAVTLPVCLAHFKDSVQQQSNLIH